jgi:sporulation protein YlmC with PRC-barrel domain
LQGTGDRPGSFVLKYDWNKREDAMHTLVPSDRVEHVAVYGRDGTRLGTIERLMLDKASGTVAYAVIRTGGLFGSHHHYPVQWSGLRYDPVRQAFETGLTLEDLQAGPCEFDDDTFDWGDRTRSYPHANYWTV